MAWVKIDKGIIESYCFANPISLKIWVWLLVKANFKKSYASLKIGKGDTTVEVGRGQLLFGRHRAEEELKIDGSTIYRYLKKFEELGQIKIEPSNQYSVITICKYNDYQNINDDNEQPTNNQRTTNALPKNNQRAGNEQPTNTSEELLEDKELLEVKNRGSDLKMPFNGTFSQKWENWKDYKIKQHKFKYKSEQTEQAALDDLVKLSGGVENLAIEIIQQSIAKGWKGLFELKNNNYGSISSKGLITNNGNRNEPFDNP